MSDQKSRCEVLKEVVDQIEVLYDEGKLEWILAAFYHNWQMSKCDAD